MIAPTLNCGGGGDCAPGEECLPDDYINPDDCPPVDCPDGQECLPSNYIDPADCPLAPLDSPDQLPDLLLWFDANDAGTITLDGDDRVETWADKSGNGNDLESASGVGPLYDGATTLNGLPVVLCDPGSTRLSSVAPVAAPQPLTVFIVVEMGGTAPTLLFPNIYEFNGGLNLFRRDDSQQTMAVAGSSPDYPSMLFATGNRAGHIITILNDDANGSSGWQDGALQFTGLDLGGDDGSGTFYLGNGSSNRGLAGIDGGGYIAEFIAYSAALSNEQVALVEDYLRRKWFSLQPEPCAYVPFCFNNETKYNDLDGIVLALSPHAYLKLDEASGLPQDSSGNGNHATAISGATYSEDPLTNKANDSIRLTGAITLPPPVSDPSNPGQAWTAIWLAQWHTYNTNATANGFPGILNWCGASPPKFMLSTCFGGATDGIMSHLFDSQFGDIGHTSLAAWPITLEEVYVIAVVANGSSSIVYMNGTPWCASYREGDGVVGTTWDLGQNSGNNSPFFSSSDWTISNFAQFSSALSYADIHAITEAMFDAAAVAGADVFT